MEPDVCIAWCTLGAGKLYECAMVRLGDDDDADEDAASGKRRWDCLWLGWWPTVVAADWMLAVDMSCRMCRGLAVACMSDAMRSICGRCICVWAWSSGGAWPAPPRRFRLLLPLTDDEEGGDRWTAAFSRE